MRLSSRLSNHLSNHLSSHLSSRLNNNLNSRLSSHSSPLHNREEGNLRITRPKDNLPIHLSHLLPKRFLYSR